MLQMLSPFERKLLSMVLERESEKPRFTEGIYEKEVSEAFDDQVWDI